jgi:hypothetical protein
MRTAKKNLIAIIEVKKKFREKKVNGRVLLKWILKKEFATL